jgi:lycopene beta-cyclase
MTRVVIAGGGLSGGLAGIAIAKRRPEVDLLLIEQGERIGGNHIWSFFDTDIAPEDRWVIETVEAHHWPDHEVRFPARSRVIPIGYNSIRSVDLDAAVQRTLRPEQIRLGQAIGSVGAKFVELADGTRLDAECVIDARGPEPMPGLDLGWQKFVGRVYCFPQPHGVHRPVVMDATVEQSDGYRFVYYLPFTEDRLLIEDTYYSRSPDLDRNSIGERLSEAVSRLDGRAEIESEESGILPVVMNGELEALWPAMDRVPKLGLRGGFFHPTTGYSLPDAVANAAWLAAQDSFGGRMAEALRDRSLRLWSGRGFFRLLNRMLFGAAEPDQSYKVLQHFYRLPSPIIARFYGSRSTFGDKVRILSGRPPVPIGRAVSALLRGAA